MQAFSRQLVLWQCPQCGEVAEYSLHRNDVQQKKHISIKPILPNCVACGADIRLLYPTKPRADARLIALTGTCASGKSTTAEALIARHGFCGIDGNVVSYDVIRHKLGITRCAFNSMEVLQEIALEIDILLALGKDIVLSQVIIPQDLPTYREMFRSRGLRYKIFVLQPQYMTAVSRSKKRNCFPSTTLEEWIKHFHDAMHDFTPKDDVVIFDNTALSVEESAERIIQLFHHAEEH